MAGRVLPGRGNIGEQAEAGWKAATTEAKRAIIRTVADVRVRKAGRGGANQWHGPVPARTRVDWTWLIGPDAE